jgi:hypothetical protein
MYNSSHQCHKIRLSNFVTEVANHSYSGLRPGISISKTDGEECHGTLELWAVSRGLSPFL